MSHISPEFINKVVSRHLAQLAALVAVIPVIAVTVTYIIAASEGFVTWCVPFWDSCTSISATGRQGLAFYSFKITLLPMAVLYWQYWRQCSAVLEQAGSYKLILLVPAGVAVTALSVYVLALGLAGDSLQLLRRTGIILFFAFTYLCQLLVVQQLLARRLGVTALRWQRLMLLVILLTGLLSVVLDSLLADYDRIEDAFEWNLALLLHLNFLLAALGWRQFAAYRD